MPRLLITGASGFVGGNLAVIASRTWEVTGSYNSHRPELGGVRTKQLDIASETAVAEAIECVKPDAAIHLAAMSNIDECQKEQDAAYRVNVIGTANLADACRASGARLVSISTDNVFDGKRGCYSEDDAPNPINFYGRSKVLAETEVLKRAPGALVVRIPLMLGFPLTEAGSFLGGIVRALRARQPVMFFTDEWRTPCDVFTLCDALVELAANEMSGILHLGGTERVSRAEIGRSLLRRLRLDEEMATYTTAAEAMKGRAPRPPDVSFDVTRARQVLATALLDLERSMDRIWEATAPDALRLS